MTKHRIGVIGVGYWGPNHVRTFSQLPDTEVAAVSDLNWSRLEKIKKQYSNIYCTEEYRTILEDPSIDSIVVATPTVTHAQIVRDVLNWNKNVLCEKPLCSEVLDGSDLPLLAESKGKVLMVGHIFLFNSGIIKLKELIESNELGEILCLSSVRTNLGPVRYDVNAASDLAAHDIAIFSWLLGKLPIEVSAVGASFLKSGIEDVVFATLTYSKKCLAHMHASWIEPKKVRQITIVGDKRMAVWDDMQPGMPIMIYDKGAVSEYNNFGEFLKTTTWEGDIRIPKVDASEPLRTQAEEFIKYVENGNVEKSDGRFGLDVVSVLQAINKSIQMKGGSVTL